MRLVGESWPLPLSRSHYEYLALTHQARLAPGLVPAVLHHNEALALVVMELLEPHIIMRKGLVAGTLYPRFVEDITTFLARTLFFSSDLAVPAAEKKEGIAAFAGNHALCKITEDLIFTDPYRVAEQNRWTSHGSTRPRPPSVRTSTCMSRSPGSSSNSWARRKR